MDGFISKKHNFGYKFIPKVACTSIKSALILAEGKPSRPFFRIVRKRKPGKIKLLNYKLVKRRRLNPHKMVDRFFNDCIDSSSEKFLVIRDPVKRFVSAYSNRVLYHQELSQRFVKKKFPELVGNLPGYNPDLSHYIENYETYSQVYPIWHHSKSFTEFLEGEELGYFSDVYTIENLNAFEEKLSSIYDQKISFPRLQTGGRSISLKELSRSELNKIIDLYEDDYQLLQDYYTPDAILKEWQGS